MNPYHLEERLMGELVSFVNNFARVNKKMNLSEMSFRLLIGFIFSDNQYHK